jgi:hypothetical protein
MKLLMASAEMRRDLPTLKLFNSPVAISSSIFLSDKFNSRATSGILYAFGRSTSCTSICIGFAPWCALDVRRIVAYNAFTEKAMSVSKRHVTQEGQKYDRANVIRWKAMLRNDDQTVGASVVVDHLNRKDLPADDPVKRLLRLYQQLQNPFTYEQAKLDIPQFIRKLTLPPLRFALVPVVGEMDSSGHWPVGWQFTGKVSQDLALPLIKLITLGGERFRECLNCGTWFYARRSHMKFCRVGCQYEAQHADPEFKKRRADKARARRKHTPKGGKS